MVDSAPVGQLIDAYFDLREEKRTHEAQIKILNDHMSRIEAAIMEKLDHEQVDQSRGHKATASISESVVPTVTDYEAFSKFVLRHKAIHLLEKRVSSRAYREMLEERGEVPGLEPYTKRRLNVQKRSK